MEILSMMSGHLRSEYAIITIIEPEIALLASEILRHRIPKSAQQLQESFPANQARGI